MSAAGQALQKIFQYLSTRPALCAELASQMTAPVVAPAPQADTSKTVAAALRPLVDRLAEIENTIDAIARGDAERKYLHALTKCSYVNGGLHIDTEKLAEELAKLAHCNYLRKPSFRPSRPSPVTCAPMIAPA